MKTNESNVDLVKKIIEISNKMRDDTEYYLAKGVKPSWTVTLVNEKDHSYSVILEAHKEGTGKKLWTSFDKEIYKSKTDPTTKYHLDAHQVTETVRLTDKLFKSFKKDKAETEAHQRANYFAKLVSETTGAFKNWQDMTYNLDARSPFVVLQQECVEKIKDIKFLGSYTVNSCKKISYNIDDIDDIKEEHDVMLEENIRKKTGYSANAYVLSVGRKDQSSDSWSQKIEYDVDCYQIPLSAGEDIQMRGRFYRSEESRQRHDPPPKKEEKRFENWMTQWQDLYNANTRMRSDSL